MVTAQVRCMGRTSTDGVPASPARRLKSDAIRPLEAEVKILGSDVERLYGHGTEEGWYFCPMFAPEPDLLMDLLCTVYSAQQRVSLQQDPDFGPPFHTV